MYARFDDLRPRRRRAFELHTPLGTFDAYTTEAVRDVIEHAERAVADGKWVAGWVSYEAAPAFDRALEVRPVSGTDVAELPLAIFVVFAGRRQTRSRRSGPYDLGAWWPATDSEQHASAVEAIRNHIRLGNTYQVNHTFRMKARFSGDAESLYHDLAHSQNTAYGAFIDTGRWAIASASPELFFEWRHGWITSKPMKGTTRRGLDLRDDEERRSWLVRSDKNRAENLMIVDMVRNDLGRIARTGSVTVPALFTTEKYDTVWQLTSTVQAEPRRDVRLADVFGAIFPCASITGAPKVATMKIINELETDPRGVYCGAIGFGGPGTDGEPQWAFNVGIRTVTLDRARDLALYGTGGGITYDSTADEEYEEALLKAAVLDRRSADFELVETMRWDPATGFRNLDRHLRRLSDSAWYFDVPLDPAEVRAALERATRGQGTPLRVRLLVDRTGWVTVQAASAPPPAATPVRLAIDDIPVRSLDPFLHHKTTNRNVYEEAAARHPEADDVVLVNEGGEVTETTIASLAVRIDGEWRTPPLSSGCLPGVERARAIDEGRLSERPITVTDLRSAESIARLNSLRGWETCVLLPPVLASHVSAGGDVGRKNPVR